MVHHLSEPVTHGDFHDGNVFVHWPSDESLLPKFLIGDWDSLSTWPEHANTRTNMLNFNRQRMDDLRGLNASLMNAEQCGRDGSAFSKIDNPYAVFKELLFEAKVLHRRDPSGFNPTKCIANPILSLAKQKIAHLSCQSTTSFRTMRPKRLSRKFVTFVENRREAVLETWEAQQSIKEMEVRPVRQPWRWVTVSELPVLLQGRGKYCFEGTNSVRIHEQIVDDLFEMGT